MLRPIGQGTMKKNQSEKEKSGHSGRDHSYRRAQDRSCCGLARSHRGVVLIHLGIGMDPFVSSVSLNPFRIFSHFGFGSCTT